MNNRNDDEKQAVCNNVGKGFAITGDSDIAAENCALPQGPGKGFAKTDPAAPDESKGEETAVDCSNAGKGFANTDGNSIVPENCALPQGPGKGFAKTDTGK